MTARSSLGVVTSSAGRGPTSQPAPPTDSQRATGPPRPLPAGRWSQPVRHDCFPRLAASPGATASATRGWPAARALDERFRPDAGARSAPARSRFRERVAPGRLALLIESGLAAAFCVRVQPAAPTGLPASSSPLVHPPRSTRCSAVPPDQGRAGSPDCVGKSAAGDSNREPCIRRRPSRQGRHDARILPSGTGSRHLPCRATRLRRRGVEVRPLCQACVRQLLLLDY
jgi:hypothetical protein